ncbi:MAG: helix-turn-helix domain-containing protein [Lachnospiraceae bacterium]|nr:helix-turn-helix domain-containing protein [Lachnospiraceae bacterium]
MTYPTIDMEATGRRIKELRKQHHLKVEEIAEFMGFESEQAIYKWQRGESLPKIENLFALSRIFGIKVDDIIIEKTEEDESPLLPFPKTLYR